MLTEILVFYGITGSILVFWLIALVLSGAWGLAGRWILLHPDRVVPKDLFSSHESLSARVGRAEITFVGTFMVFAGAVGTVFYTAVLLRSPEWVAQFVAVAVGSYIGYRVYKDVRQRTTRAIKS